MFVSIFAFFRYFPRYLANLFPIIPRYLFRYIFQQITFRREVPFYRKHRTPVALFNLAYDSTTQQQRNHPSNYRSTQEKYFIQLIPYRREVPSYHKRSTAQPSNSSRIIVKYFIRYMFRYFCRYLSDNFPDIFADIRLIFSDIVSVIYFAIPFSAN